MTRSPNRVAAAVGAALGAIVAAVSLAQGRVPLGVSILIATALLLAGAIASVGLARGANLAVGTASLLTGFAGLFLVGTSLNPLALTALDELALFGAATGLLAVGLGARRDQPPRS